MTSIKRPTCNNCNYSSKMHRLTIDVQYPTHRPLPVGWFCKVCRNVLLDYNRIEKP